MDARVMRGRMVGLAAEIRPQAGRIKAVEERKRGT
jgi:hypothetical protein